MNVYETVHPISQTVCRAVAEGLDVPVLPASEGLKEGPAIVYGLLRGCGEIVRHCQTVGRTFYHIDNGIFRRGHYGGYYRVSRNGLQPVLSCGGVLYPEAGKGGDNAGGDCPSGRWEALGIDLKPWRKTGRYILIVPPSEFMMWWDKLDEDWLDKVVAEVKLHTDRPVMIKGPQKGDLDKALSNAWCVVTYNSMSAAHALVEGVPSLTLSPGHVASSVSWTFENIESPVYPDREPWAFACAYHQYTLEELRHCRELEIGTSRSTMILRDEIYQRPKPTTIASHIFGAST